MLGISTNEYCLCDKVFKLQSNPGSKTPGWAYASRETYSKFLGISSRAVIDMINRMVAAGLLERGTAQGLLRVTKKWYDLVVVGERRLQLMGEETSHDGVKKLQGGGEETSPKGVKKLHLRGEETSDNNKRENKSENKIENYLLPDGLNTEKFRSAFSTLLQMPKWKKKPATAVEMALKRVSKYEADFAVQLVETTIEGNYQGLVFNDTDLKYKKWKQDSTAPAASKQKQDNGGQKFTFDLNKSVDGAAEWLEQYKREMAAERAMRGY